MSVLSIKKIVITAMLSALIFVTTTFINIPVFPSTGGLIHFGNIFIFLIALTMDKEYSLSGAIGLTLFDLLNSYTIWAPVTFISRFLMAYIVNKLAYKSNNSLRIITAMLFGAIVCALMYYVYEAVFISSFYAALASLLSDTITLVISIFISFALLPLVRRMLKNLDI